MGELAGAQEEVEALRRQVQKTSARHTDEIGKLKAENASLQNRLFHASVRNGNVTAAFAT